MSINPKIELIVRSFTDGKVVGLVTSDDQGGWTWRASRTVGTFLICSAVDGPRAGHVGSLARALSGLLG